MSDPAGDVRKRKPMSKRLRFEVFKRDSFKCQYCGKSAPDVILQVDHISPVSKGGEDDILNLVTSCAECNAGKSDIELNDSAVIQRQREQLEALNERREQLEMMLEWRQGLEQIDENTIAAAVTAFERKTTGYELNANGLQTIRRHVRKYGLPAVLSAIDTATDQYLKFENDGKVTGASFEVALYRLGGLLRTKDDPEWKRQLYYIRGILRNRMNVKPWDQPAIMRDMEAAVGAGVNVEHIKSLALAAENLNEFFEWLGEAEARKRGSS